MSGVRVIDVGTFLAGHYAASILGEFGAEILKVEHPIAGDPMRRFRRKVGLLGLREVAAFDLGELS